MDQQQQEGSRIEIEVMDQQQDGSNIEIERKRSVKFCDIVDVREFEPSIDLEPEDCQIHEATPIKEPWNATHDPLPENGEKSNLEGEKTLLSEISSSPLMKTHYCNTINQSSKGVLGLNEIRRRFAYPRQDYFLDR